MTGMRGVVTHKVYEVASAARYAHVNIAHCVEHLGRCFMGGGKEHRYVRTDAVGFEGLMNQRDSRTVGCLGVASPFEHAALPLLKQSENTSKVTLGRASYITPITPNGTSPAV